MPPSKVCPQCNAVVPIRLKVCRNRLKFALYNADRVNFKSRNYHVVAYNISILAEGLHFSALVKSMRSPTDHYNIYNFVEFSSRPTRRSCSNFKLKHSISRTNMEGNFYFNRIPRLWNSLPTLDANLSLSTIKYKLHKYFWDYFIAHFDPNDECSFHYLCLCQKCSSLPVNMHLGNSSI